MMGNSDIELLDLPDVVLDNVLSFLSYNDIAKNRLVCRRFDTRCKSLLNRGFNMVERRQLLVSRAIKHCLPRRESERRAHPLARHCEILSALETRISMLSMTFIKFIEVGLCCFIPGKIIDEILQILKVVQTSTTPPRTHDLLQELRDISSMAMEHFEEHIAPDLRASDENLQKQRYLQSRKISLPRSSRSINVSDIIPDIIHKEMKQMMNNATAYRQQLSRMKKYMNQMVRKVNVQGNFIVYQREQLREQRRLIRIQNQTIADIKTHLEETDKKLLELTTKSTGSKAVQTNETPFQYFKPSKSPVKGRDSIKSLYEQFIIDKQIPPKETLPNRRTTISDFRSQEPNLRKRKLIDIITNVIDTKVPKAASGESEVTQFLKQFPNEGYDMWKRRRFGNNDPIRRTLDRST